MHCSSFTPASTRFLIQSLMHFYNCCGTHTPKLIVMASLHELIPKQPDCNQWCVPACDLSTSLTPTGYTDESLHSVHWPLPSHTYLHA